MTLGIPRKCVREAVHVAKVPSVTFLTISEDVGVLFVFIVDVNIMRIKCIVYYQIINKSYHCISDLLSSYK